MSPLDIIARLERSPAAWVCIRREAADEIRKLRAEIALAVEALEMVMQHGRIDNSESRMNIVALALAKIKETK